MMQSLGRRYVQHFNFADDRGGTLPEEIRDDTLKGMAIGNERFKEEPAALTGRHLRSRKRGPAGRMEEGEGLILL